jgi:hypothetical protein
MKWAYIKSYEERKYDIENIKINLMNIEKMSEKIVFK